ncbi:MAG: pseudouridylate synthase, partial [Bacteroidetes bacterium]
MISPSLCYLDEWLVAAYKPPGLLVHPSQQDRQAEGSLMQQLRDHLGQHVYPVHRLDKGTSGLVLMARDPDTARRLNQSWASREVEKSYLALLRGYTDPQGDIDYPLKPLCDRRTGRRSTDRPAQPALTHYQTLAQVELPQAVGRYETARYSLVRAQPHTGRNRQLRRHFKHIFHPIVGDRKHGDRAHNAFFAAQYGLARMLLHAEGLELQHPHTGERLSLHAPIRGAF